MSRNALRENVRMAAFFIVIAIVIAAILYFTSPKQPSSLSQSPSQANATKKIVQISNYVPGRRASLDAAVPENDSAAREVLGRLQETVAKRANLTLKTTYAMDIILYNKIMGGTAAEFAYDGLFRYDSDIVYNESYKWSPNVTGRLHRAYSKNHMFCDDRYNWTCIRSDGEYPGFMGDPVYQLLYFDDTVLLDGGGIASPENGECFLIKGTRRDIRSRTCYAPDGAMISMAYNAKNVSVLLTLTSRGEAVAGDLELPK